MLDGDWGANNHKHYGNRNVNIDDKGTTPTDVHSSNMHLTNVSPILRINVHEPEISSSLGSKGNRTACLIINSSI